MHRSPHNETLLGAAAHRAEVTATHTFRVDTGSRDWLAAWRRILLRPEVTIAAASALLLSSWIGARVVRDLGLREAWFSLTILCVALPWLGYALVQLGLLTGVALGIVPVEGRTVPRGRWWVRARRGRFGADRGVGGVEDWRRKAEIGRVAPGPEGFATR